MQGTAGDSTTVDPSSTSSEDHELVQWILLRLRRKGPECLSQLAVEFRRFHLSNRRLQALLERLRADGLVVERPHEDEGLEYGPDEVRWGLPTFRFPAKPALKG